MVIICSRFAVKGNSFVWSGGVGARTCLVVASGRGRRLCMRCVCCVCCMCCVCCVRCVCCLCCVCCKCCVCCVRCLCRVCCVCCVCCLRCLCRVFRVCCVCCVCSLCCVFCVCCVCAVCAVHADSRALGAHSILYTCQSGRRRFQHVSTRPVCIASVRAYVCVCVCL